MQSLTGFLLFLLVHSTEKQKCIPPLDVESDSHSGFSHCSAMFPMDRMMSTNNELLRWFKNSAQVVQRKRGGELSLTAAQILGSRHSKSADLINRSGLPSAHEWYSHLCTIMLSCFADRYSATVPITDQPEMTFNKSMRVCH